MDVLCQMLCAVDRAMLPACAAKREHEMGETTLHIARYMVVSELIDVF